MVMIVAEEILGNLGEDARLTDLHQRWRVRGRAETVELTALEAEKARLRTMTDRGTPLRISLERGTILRDGDVLHINESEEHIIVVRLRPEEVLVITVKPANSASELLQVAVKLGHVLGNQHWPVKIEGTSIYVPVSVDRKVMETVLKTYGLQGIEYRFEHGSLGAISRVIPREHPHPHGHHH
jgi:urease accessory protein